MRGAIAAGHPLSAEAGARVLRDGGNAVDALLAAAFAAFVTEGPLTGPAGGGFALVHEPSGETTVLDCFFEVPTRGLGEMEELVIDFGDSGTQVFHVGEGSVAVPGLLAGLEEIHGRFASREWSDLVEPAIELARVGFERDEPRAFLHLILEGILLRDEGGSGIYGDPARVQTQHAVETLERVRDAGAAMVAELLPEYADDLRTYRPIPVAPLEVEVLGRVVRSTPSQGGGVVQRILALLDAAGEPSLEDEARAVADAYGPLGSGPLPGTTHISVVDETGHGCRALVDPGLGIRRLSRRHAAQQHARRARRDRPAREGAGRAAREHDDADARAAFRPARARYRERRLRAARRRDRTGHVAHPSRHARRRRDPGAAPACRGRDAPTRRRLVGRRGRPRFPRRGT